MAPIDFNTLNTESEWQDELDRLVAAAAEACLPHPDGTEAEREEVREDLRAFQDYPCPFEYMQDAALEALDSLTLADIQEALHLLQKLQWQLQQGSPRSNATQLAAFAQRSSLPPNRSALLARPESAPKDRALTAQIQTLNSTVKQLLATDAAGR